MSKTKIKRKTTGFDIIYRVVTAAMAVAIFPLAYFAKMLFVVVKHEELSGILNLFTETEDPGGTYFEFAIADVFDSNSTVNMLLKMNDGEGFSFSAIWENEYLRAVLFTAIFFAIALVIALVILGFAIFSNKQKVIACLSVGGLLAMAASFISFTTFFANPITSGEVSIGKVFELSGFVVNLALGFFDITTIQLEGAFFWVAFLLLGILIWSVSVIIVNASDEKEKQLKKMEQARKR